VQGATYVIGTVNASVGFTDGQLNYVVTAETIFGPVTVSNLPGQNASLNT
jgi:hypothetical protein